MKSLDQNTAALSGAENTDAFSARAYKSRPGALVWFFRKSRDNWKQKCRNAKKENKLLKNKTNDLEKSRDSWKGKCQQLQEQLRQLREEKDAINEQLRQHQDQTAEQKKTKRSTKRSTD